jgi:hypothetical protein
MSKESRIDKAARKMPHREVSKPPAGDRGSGSDVGNERKADVRGAQEGGSRAEGCCGSTHLGHAVKELHSQHPHGHMDRGPHHEWRGKVRHEPLHGMTPHK